MGDVWVAGFRHNWGARWQKVDYQFCIWLLVWGCAVLIQVVDGCDTIGVAPRGGLG